MNVSDGSLFVQWVETSFAYFYVDMYNDAMQSGGTHARIWTACAISIPVAVTMAVQKTIWEPARHILKWASRRVNKLERGVGHVARSRKKPMVVQAQRKPKPPKRPGMFSRFGRMIGVEVVR